MTIFKSAKPDVDIPDVSVTDFVLRHAAAKAEHVAFVEGMSGREVTYGALAAQIRAFAGA